MHLHLRRSGVAAALLLLVLPSVAFAAAASHEVVFGNVPINTTVTQSVTITVDAGYRITSATGSGLSAPFAFSFDTCSAGGGFTGPGTCNVNESFTPTATGFASGITNVFVCPTAGDFCIAIPFSVQGTGVLAAAASPDSIDFGNVPINTTVTQSVTITVDAGYRISIATGTGINVPFSFGFDTCGAGFGFTGPGKCNVSESFTPTATGLASGITNVFECPTAGGSCIAIPFSVQGTGVLAAAASPDSIDFGNVLINTTVTQSVTITADAGYRIAIASGTGINPPFAFGFDTCGAGGGFTGPGKCNVSESFTPTATGLASGITDVYECPIVSGSCIEIPFSVQGTGVLATVPGAPSGVIATRGNASALVSWTAPASHGSPITGYTVTSSPGSKTCTTTGATHCTVTGLTNGTPYTFTVKATNSVGTGLASAASRSVTPATVPGAPSGVIATRGNASALVSWTAPASHGSPITGYTVTSSPGSKTCTTTGATHCTVTGLTNGTPYTFTVKATNSVGTSAASAPSVPVTPSAAAVASSSGVGGDAAMPRSGAGVEPPADESSALAPGRFGIVPGLA